MSGPSTFPGRGWSDVVAESDGVAEVVSSGVEVAAEAVVDAAADVGAATVTTCTRGAARTKATTGRGTDETGGGGVAGVTVGAAATTPPRCGASAARRERSCSQPTPAPATSAYTPKRRIHGHARAHDDRTGGAGRMSSPVPFTA